MSLIPRCSFAVGLVSCALSACHVEAPAPPPVGQPFDLWELEPNDGHCCPDDLGWLWVGDEFVIGGRIRDDGLDPFDGFRLRSAEPCAVRFWLEPLSAVSDLDLCVWDEQLNDFAFCFASAGPVEQGLFNVFSGGHAFHLVVGAYVGDSEYRLRVRCEPIGLGLSESGPGAAAAPAERRAAFERYAPLPSSSPVTESSRWSAGPLWVIEIDPRDASTRVLPGAWLAPPAERLAGSGE